MTKTNIPTPSAPTNVYPPNEAFLHYIWKTKYFSFNALQSTSGQPIKIIKWGMHNHVSGPDFLDAVIECNGVTWAGHVEIHIKSSDWYKHHHQLDAAYDQVVLHVVWEDDRPVTDMHLNPITTLELKDRVDPALIDRISHLLQNQSKIACHSQIGSLSTFWLNAWKERQLIERLEFRTARIEKRLEAVNGDWEQIACEMLFRSMGFYANSDQLEQLARKLTWPLIRKLVHDRLALAALLFGRGGFLDESHTDPYPTQLKKQFEFLKLKYNISSRSFIKWNFMGARPANFPTIRMAQLASWLVDKKSLIRTMIECESLHALYACFEMAPDPYWQNHYLFDKPVNKTRIQLSRPSINSIIINYCIPLLYSYGRFQHDEKLKERAIQFLYQLPSEKNNVVKSFTDSGLAVRCAGESQALLHTYRHYCASKKCLNCQVGSQLLRRPMQL